MDLSMTRQARRFLRRRPRDQSCPRWDGGSARPCAHGVNHVHLKVRNPSCVIAAGHSSASIASMSLATGDASRAPPLALSTETYSSPRLRSTFAQSQSPLSTAQRESPGGGPAGSDPGPGPNAPDPQPSGGPGGPGGGMPFRLRYWILLLAEYGGIYGTAAVIIAALTHVDAFGGVHWDASDVVLGLSFMAPALAWDAVVGLPDWTTRHEDAEALVRLFVDPELLRAQPSGGSAGIADKERDERERTEEGKEQGAAGAMTVLTVVDSPTTGSTAGGDTGASASDEADAAASRRIENISASASSSSSSGSSGGQQPSALWAASQRLRMALELMQETSIRNNPGARLTALQEAAVIGVAVTADEMLYRAVLLTLFGRWLRDRFYEAGAEEVLALPGDGLLDTAVAAQWTALAVGVAAGAAVFAAKAWQEATMAKRLRALQMAEREEAAKALRKQQLSGQHMTEEELRELDARQTRLQAAHESLVASIGMQGALVWVLEGAREVYQVTAVGAAFILTGNLAAPLVGSLVAQVLVSIYQRLGLKRNLRRRAEVVAKRRQRRLQEEAAAATTAAAAAEATVEAPQAPEPQTEEAPRQEGAAQGPASDAQQQQQLAQEESHEREK